MPPSPAIVLLAVWPWVVGAAPATAPPTTAGGLELSDRVGMAAEYALLPRLAARPVHRLLGLRLEDGFVRVTGTGLPDGDATVDLTGWPGLTKLTTVGGDGAFVFAHFSFDDRGAAVSATNVLVHTDYVQINRDYEADATRPDVTLIQSRQFAEANDDPVKLLVRGPAAAPPGDRLDLKLTAATFAALCHEQPVAVRTYLLPIFRDLNAAGLVRGSDPAGAYQVLGAALPPDPATARRVDATLGRLAAADPAARARAEEELMALGPAGAAELRRRDLSALSPDARAAADNATRAAEPLDADAVAALADDVPFLLDTLNLNEPALTTAAAARIKALTGKTIDLPDDLPATEREKRIADFTATLTPSTRPGPPRTGG